MYGYDRAGGGRRIARASEDARWLLARRPHHRVPPAHGAFGSGSRVGVLLGQPLIRELSTRLNAAGIGSFKFNNRGHDVVTGLGKQFAGAAFQALRAERSPSRIPKPLVPERVALSVIHRHHGPAGSPRLSDLIVRWIRRQQGATRPWARSPLYGPRIWPIRRSPAGTPACC